MKRMPLGWSCSTALLLTVAFACPARAQSVETWATAETLLWWTKQGPAPVPLASTAPAGSPGPIPGALGNADTTVVLGGSEIGHDLQLGGRFTLGRMNRDAGVGLDANFLFLGKSSNSQTVADDGTQFLVNPFFEPTVQLPIANYLTTPGILNQGSATLNTTHQLYGAELNGLVSLVETGRASWQLIGGYRFLNVDEDLSLATTQADSVSFFPGQFVNTIDEFETRNYFNGGQLGLRGEWTRGIWSFGSTCKLALGATHEVVRISGSTTTNSGPTFATEIPVTTVPGGIFAQPTNIGEYSRDRFAVLPEVSLRLGVQLTPRVRTFVGYDFMYLSSVARPGNQIDGTINGSQLTSFTGVPTGPLVGQASPAPQFASTDYWAQGINLGAEFAW